VDHSSRQKSRARLLFAAVLLLACAVPATLGGLAIRHIPIAFDGGFNAQVARTLVEKGRYATTYRGLNDFDLRVQTGPAVIVPVAYAFRDLGVNSTTAQIPNLIYLVLLFALAATYAYRHGGPVAAMLAVLLLLGVPRLFVLGLGVLGEVPAVVFFLAGLICLDLVTERRWIVAALAAGGFFGLAVSTKIMMAMAVAVVVPVAVADRLSSRRVGFRHWITMAAGFVLALLPLEILRLRTLGPAGFLQWWDELLRRSFSQGTSVGFADPTLGIDKSVRHLAVLARHLSSPEWLTFIVLACPFLLLAALMLHDRREAGAHRRLSLSAIVLAAAAAVLVGWWLTMSPTGHTWLRRVLAGLILLAELSSILIVEGGRQMVASARQVPKASERRSVRVAVEVSVTLLLCWSWLVGNGVASLGAVTEMTPEREWSDVMVTAINRLPRDATIYTEGWYEAPTLSALTGRSFRDLDQFPLSQYRTPLHETYFVADDHMSRNRPDMVESLLARASTDLVQEVGECSLYQVNRLEPFPPITVPADISELPTAVRPGQDEDPYVGGLGTTPKTRSYSHAVSGFLLRRGAVGCLDLSLWISGSAPHTKVLQVRVDGRQLLTTPVPEQAKFQTVLKLPGAVPASPAASLVELWMYRWGPTRAYQLWFNDLGVFTVGKVGFIRCPEDSDTASSDGGSDLRTEVGPTP
jgi:4-amino-4-deoxy-L-arabinose transferase-like glycosyltransferase